MSRAKKGAIITAILILLYGVFGFLIAPYILKSNLISGIAGQLGRNVTVNEVKVNPFVLSVTLRGFEISEPDGEFKLNEFRLSEKGIDDTLISVPCFSVKGVHIDLSNKKAICASVNSNNAFFKSRLTSDGTLNYQAQTANSGASALRN